MRRILACIFGLAFLAACQPARWHPPAHPTWQWQLTGTIDQSVVADIYDIDLFDTSKATVTSLHNKGRKVICYLSVGSWEDWRPDAGQFPTSVKGQSNGWPGERWLDIRRIDILGPIMEARLDLCKTKGFDGVEPDNVDGYTNSTGFPLTGNHQIAYNRFLAREAHERGLAIGLKNDVEQTDELVSYFDFAVNEQCFEYDECDTYEPFLDRGKPVLHAEYDLTLNQFCPESDDLGLSSIRKREDLDAWRQVCP